MDEVGIGLDGAENMGHDGERGEVGLGFGGLQDITTRKLISTQGNHSGSTGGSWRGQMTGCCSRTREHQSPEACCPVSVLQVGCLRLPRNAFALMS